ncbi:MAG: hypothetical protein FJ265_05115 [Planctomycetes bacterium]|nr:hypothetical protein [Planctomycetota bacterium]
MQSLLLCGLCAALAASQAFAQRLAVYDPTSTGGPGFIEVTAPTLMVPGGSPPVLMYPEMPPLGPPPNFQVPPGDSTFDGINVYHLYTNGLAIAGSPTPAFPPIAAPFPVTPIPGNVLLAIGGPVTGMAIAQAMAAVPTIFLVSAPGRVLGVAAAAGLPIAVPLFPIPFGLLAPITGLEWDGLTNQLLAVDALGNVYPFFPGGVPAGPMIPSKNVIGAGIAGDVAIDKTGMLNPWNARSIYVVCGPVYMDMTCPLLPPPVYITGGSPNATGLAFQPHPAAMPVMGVCPCPNFPLGQGVLGPMTAGNARFGFLLTGLPAGQLALIAFDFFHNPAFPLINGIGCGFGFWFGSPTLVSTFVFADLAGNVRYPMPLFLPPGTGPLFYQAGTFCPADPVLGVVITPMYQFSACGL